MEATAEVILRQRFCRAESCGTIFWICRCCDRGQQYCSDLCRSKGRRQQRRAANLRHQGSIEGKLDHRDRQRAYRQRLAASRVTDQGSADRPPEGNIPLPAYAPPAAAGNGSKSSLQIRTIHDLGMPCCVLCHRPGRFVDPFHRLR